MYESLTILLGPTAQLVLPMVVAISVANNTRMFLDLGSATSAKKEFRAKELK